MSYGLVSLAAVMHSESEKRSAGAKMTQITGIFTVSSETS
jgi:hypothetical protein